MTDSCAALQAPEPRPAHDVGNRAGVLAALSMRDSNHAEYLLMLTGARTDTLHQRLQGGAACTHHGERAGFRAALVAQLAANAGAGAGRLARLAGGAGRAAGALQRDRLPGGAPSVPCCKC